MLKHITAIFDQATPVDKTIRISFLLSLFFHLIAVYFSEGHHKLDEYGGIFAYTGHGLGLWGNEFLNPGEFPARIRPWLQPLLYMIPISPYTYLGGSNPFVVNTLMRLISSLFGLLGLWSLIKNLDFFSTDKNVQKLMVLGLTLFWFFPYFHARSTAENLGATFFLIPLGLILSGRHFLFAGILLSFSFFLRFQMVVMIASLICWLVFFKPKGMIKILVGGIIGSMLMVMLDSFMYGEFTFTPWQYWKFNIIDGVASSIGEDPWHYYFKKIFLKGIPPLSLVIYGATLWYWIKKPKDLVTWLMIPFFIVHCLIAHKELRFLYPLSFFLPLIFAHWIEIMPRRSLILKSILIINLLILPIASIKPAFSAIGLYHFIWDKKITEVNVLGDFPRPLRLYLRNQTINIKKVPDIDSVSGWIFSNKYAYFEKLLKQKNCELQYSSYPKWLLDLAPEKFRKRSKVFSLFLCH